MDRISKLAIILLVFFPLQGWSQTHSYDNEQLTAICDSILLEAETLYRMEKAAWLLTDGAQSIENVRNHFMNYVVYRDKKKYRAVAYNRNVESIYELTFTENAESPNDERQEIRRLTKQERKLIAVRENILGQIGDQEIPVTVYENYSPNFILIPDGKNYRFYIIPGTSLHHIIPFGNDYLFFTDHKGNITSWRKMHSRLLPLQTGSAENPVVQTIHSHLKEEPFITASDICTFRLYGPLYGQEAFSVYSPALGKYFTYRLKENDILISDNPEQP